MPRWICTASVSTLLPLIFLYNLSYRANISHPLSNVAQWNPMWRKHVYGKLWSNKWQTLKRSKKDYIIQWWKQDTSDSSAYMASFCLANKFSKSANLATTDFCCVRVLTFCVYKCGYSPVSMDTLRLLSIHDIV